MIHIILLSDNLGISLGPDQMEIFYIDPDEDCDTGRCWGISLQKSADVGTITAEDGSCMTVAEVVETVQLSYRRGEFTTILLYRTDFINTFERLFVERGIRYKVSCS
jgi:hypothetical protein